MKCYGFKLSSSVLPKTKKLFQLIYDIAFISYNKLSEMHRILLSELKFSTSVKCDAF